MHKEKGYKDMSTTKWEKYKLRAMAALWNLVQGQREPEVTLSTSAELSFVCQVPTPHDEKFFPEARSLFTMWLH